MITIAPYNPDWPKIFEKEADALRKIFGNLIVEIHHIGSTSIPNMSAKPVIDILPAVKEIRKVDSYDDAMRSAGYEVKGEYGILFRRYFQKELNYTRTHNIHVYEVGHPEIDRHIAFRDYLREHAEEAEAYASLKRELAVKFPDDIDAYSNGKDDFVRQIDKNAGSLGTRIVKACTDRQWQAAKTYRQKYFFDKVPMDDPYAWTFEHKDHQHFILYNGTNIIGYAHIQLWPKKRAAIRIIVIDEDRRKSGFGKWFMEKIETWLKEKGYNSLHAESNPDALSFYTALGYTPMPFDDPDGYEGGEDDIAIGKIL
ncbi:GNAT family N-acetyltransferase [Rickettsiales bacterium]|nr:GNAT family N-acetyltransferase [Rickettsiales bacterium]